MQMYEKEMKEENNVKSTCKEWWNEGGRSEEVWWGCLWTAGLEIALKFRVSLNLFNMAAAMD